MGHTLAFVLAATACLPGLMAIAWDWEIPDWQRDPWARMVAPSNHRDPHSNTGDFSNRDYLDGRDYTEETSDLQDLTDYMRLLQSLRLGHLDLNSPRSSDLAVKRATKKVKQCYWSLVSCYRKKRSSEVSLPAPRDS